MAAFIQTTPPQPVAESLWRRWHLGWVVPLATAATAAAIWVALPDNEAPHSRPAQETNALARDERNAALSSDRQRYRAQPAASAPPSCRASSTAGPESQGRRVCRQRGEAARRTKSKRELPICSARDALGPASRAAAACGDCSSRSSRLPAAAAERAEADAKQEAAARFSCCDRSRHARQAFAPYRDRRAGWLGALANRQRSAG